MTKRFNNQYFIFGAVLLAAGDILALLLFTFFGTMEHQMDSGFGEIWLITSPFMLGWIVSGVLTGAYRCKAYSTLPGATVAAVKTAIPGIPLGLLLRWLMYGKPPALSFAIASFLFILLFLILWRWAYTWLLRNI